MMQCEESMQEEEGSVKLVIRRQEIGERQSSDGEFEPPLFFSNNGLVKDSIHVQLQLLET